MNVFIGCEESGVIRDAFRALGHNAYSCDLKPSWNNSPYHFQADIFYALSLQPPDGGWDLGILHPECRYLSASGQHWIGKPGYENRAQDVEEAVAFFMRCAELKHAFPRLCIENPISIMTKRYRRWNQKIQPYEFGDDASKQTCLWTYNLPLLKIDPLARCDGRWVTNPVNGKLVERWSNQTDSGQNRLGPSENRSALRAETYPGPAQAMALQWGALPRIAA